MIHKGYHLTYCTNIHPGESWEAVFENLRNFIPDIKNEISPDAPFGIGLRLSSEASLELSQPGELAKFQEWLAANNCYVFTFNGFPYGGFHRQVVKDEVHQPDWSSNQRLDYTLRLFDLLASLLPEGMDGGISTSPLSYRFWHLTEQAREEVIKKSTLHIAEVAVKLYRIKEGSGKELHLDIEPEPDGLLENTQEVIDYYKNRLIPLGGDYVMKQLDISREAAEKCLKDHIRLCYDVCHFAVVYEKPEEVFSALAAEGIRIGKIQISAALKLVLPEDAAQKKNFEDVLNPFVESTYLHQVVAQDRQGNLNAYRDLPAALETLKESGANEWRIHFHVPVFLSSYGQLASTQEDIVEVLRILGDQRICHHLEVETYTWEVLPESIQLDLKDSIIRELQWVKNKMN